MQQAISYEQAIKRVEEIIASLDNQVYDIDKMTGSIKEAQELLTYCSNKLGGIEKRIQNILEGNG